MSLVEEQEWRVFADWCVATDVDVLTVERIYEYLAMSPAAPSTERRRIRSIRHGLMMSGLIEEDEPAPSASTVRTGEGWAPIERALAQLPVTRYPAGLRGRRDGWLLVLIGAFGLTRRQALAVTADDVQLFPRITVLGQPVARADVAAECAACAVTRWLRTLGPAAMGYRSEVREILDVTVYDVDAHDCAVGLDGVWRSAPVMTPAIDRYGWVASRPLSMLAVSTIMRVRQRSTDLPAQYTARGPAAGRFADKTAEETYEAFDEVDAQMDAWLARTAELLGESTEMLEHLQSFGIPPAP